MFKHAIHTVYPFVKTLLFMLSISEVSTITHIISLQLSHQIRSVLLHSVQEFKDHTNKIINMMQDGHHVLLVEQDMYKLLNRINNPLSDKIKAVSDSYMRLMLLCLNVKSTLAWSVQKQYIRLGLSNSERQITIKSFIGTMFLYMPQHSPFTKD